MKVRIGFVSNSSSSSFLMYGARIPESEIDALGGSGAIGKAGLIIEFGDPNLRDYEDDPNVIVGRSWCSVGDYETGLAFRQTIEASIKELFGDRKCYTIEEAWYNG